MLAVPDGVDGGRTGVGAEAAGDEDDSAASRGAVAQYSIATSSVVP